MDILSLIMGGFIGLYSGVFANALYRKITYNKKPQTTDVYNSTIQTIHKNFNQSNAKNYQWDFNICESCNLTKRDNIAQPVTHNIDVDLIKNCPFVNTQCTSTPQ
jgi:hypothetical protein